MANVSIKLSQNVVTTMYQQLIKTPPTNGSIGSVFDTFSKLGAMWSKDHSQYSSANFTGYSLQFGFSDGATSTFSGVVLSDPNATQGTATASSSQLFKSGSVSLTQTGQYFFNYSLSSAGALTINSTGAQSTSLSVDTLIPSNSASYDPLFGNVSLSAFGSIKSDLNGNNSGTVTRIMSSADKFLASSTIDGSFNYTANSVSVGNGLSKSVVTGTMTAADTEYRDGSYMRLTGFSAPLSANQLVDEKLLANESLFSGADVISVDLPATMYSDYLIASGAGADLITINGGGGHLHVNAGSGNDAINVGTGNHNIDGGTGLDTVIMAAQASAYTVTQVGAAYQLRVNASGDVDNLSNVERIQFFDKSLALDISGTAGQAYRLYQAAFGRKPDLEGLGYWIKDMDKGSSLTTVAAGFFQSPEFQKLYGSNPSTTTLITNFYQNVLHRAPDQAGFDYWNNQLSKGQITAAGVLASFCESAENQAQVIGTIQNGIEFKLWLG
ncbi:DUF4214 domain-containing protein [Undibacterium sp. JH2W]|uniref:DUF4214 domain-containing protein n=1 Tax=Undibacterium sp. JH2W TaxID=3413037 RepID=UPI003BF52A4D